MKNTQPEAAAIQKEVFAIFLEVKKIIEKHRLRYFAIGGTCIGAIRHRGFIPWDNDMDIAMPENDYEEFLRVANDELPPHLKLIAPEGNKHYRPRFSKVHNIITTCIDKYALEYPDAYRGIYIDIMPLCGIPDDLKQYQKKSWRLATLNHLTRRCPARTGKLAKDLIHRLAWLGGNMLGNDFFYRKWYKYVTKFKFDESEFTGYIWSWNLFRANLIFPKEWFNGYVNIPFESTTIRCPVGWHEYLTKQFGNYMELPPEEKRVSHEFAIVDFDCPYTYYINMKNKGEM